jgi:hypothetical protein
MRITAVSIKNFAGVRDVAFEPHQHGLLVIGGRNEAGKSSCLNAISYCLGGPKHAPADPIRHGEKRAEVQTILDGGDLIVERVAYWGKKKNKETGESEDVLKHKLEVKNADGFRLHSPQQRLNELIGERFLDPMAFMQSKPADQRGMLLACLGLQEELDKLDHERQTAYDDRRLKGRELTTAKGRLDAAGVAGPKPPEPPAAQDASALRRQLDEAHAVGRRKASAEEDLRTAATRESAAAREVERIEALLHEAKQTLEVRAVERFDRERAVEAITVPDTFGIEMALEGVDEANAAHNDAVAVLQDWQRQADHRQAMSQAAQAVEAEHNELSLKITSLDERKRKAIEGADLPVKGLSVTEDGVIYNGVPLSQAALSRRLRVSLAIAAALKPELRAIWCKDGQALDEQSLAEVERFANEKDLLVILERVGVSDAGALIVEEGVIS